MTWNRREGPKSGIRRAGLAAAALLVWTGPAVAQTSPAPDWTQKLKLTGEVGFRAEYIQNENFAATSAVREDDHRFRLRARVRFGAEYQLAAPLTLGLRLSTGDSAYPSSGWSSLNDDFRRDLFQVDRAYLRWQVHERLQLRFGSDANPLFTPTELVWDSDVQPSGVGEIVNVGRTGVVLSAGQFMLRELRSSRPANEENSILLAQGVAYTLPIRGARLTVGGALYHFTNPDALARSVQVGELDADFKTNRFDSRGRTVADPRDPAKVLAVDYFSRYQLLNVGLKVESTAVPVSLALDLVVNRGARKDASLGAAFEATQNVAAGGMLRYSRSHGAWSWSASAGFFHIEADSVVAVYTSDDLQQTNVNSIPLEFAFRLPSGARIVSDTYVQKKIDVGLASNGGIVHGDNAPKIRTRLSIVAGF